MLCIEQEREREREREKISRVVYQISFWKKQDVSELDTTWKIKFRNKVYILSYILCFVSF